MRRLNLVVALLAILTLAAACASGLAGAIQSVQLQKTVIEATAEEFIHLARQPGSSITADTYAQARRAYGIYFEAQTAAADALAMWQSVKSPTNEEQLVASLRVARSAADAFLKIAQRAIQDEKGRK